MMTILFALGLIALVGMALTADTPYTEETGDIGWRAFPVLASAKIYEGSLVGLQVSSGYARPLSAGDIFVGSARERADNSSGASAAIDVHVRTIRYRLQMTITGVLITDVGKPVFALDDATLSLIQGNGSYVGWVHRYVTTNTAIVQFDPAWSYQRDAQNQFDFFDDAITVVTGGLWHIADTSAAGTPTYDLTTNLNGLVFTSTLAANDEAENVCLYWGDILGVLIGKIDFAEFRFIPGTIAANETCVVGMGSTRNDTPDTVTNNAWFRLEATMDLLCESDDGVSDQDDKDTTVDLVAATPCVLGIDFRTLTSLKFYHNGTRYQSATTFTLGGATATTGLQPIMQLQKASGTGTPSAALDWVRIRGRRI